MSSDTHRRYQGKIIEWSDEKSCGFVEPRGGGRNDPIVFLPRSAMANRKRTPKVGDIVLYEVSTVADSPHNRHLRTRLRAQRVVFQGEDLPAASNTGNEKGLVILGALSLLLQGGVATLFPQTVWIFVASIGLSLMAIALYGWDKSAARAKRDRVPEANLHLIALLGGWPGASLAQRLFRHKTQKQSFRLSFLLTVVFNIVLTFIAYGFLTRRGN